MSSSRDALTDPGFWTGFWQASQTLPVDPRAAFDGEMIAIFRRFGIGPTIRFLEVGCGDSRWMPWLGKNFGWSVEGIEFTKIGCERAAARLSEEGVSSVIHEGDVFGEKFNPLKSSFDVVYSGGFIEHFRETEATVRHIAGFVRPGGAIVTTVPNMYNLGVDIQRLSGYDFLKTHVRIRLDELRRWHESAGMRTLISYRTGFGLQVRLKSLSDAAQSSVPGGRTVRKSLVLGLRSCVRSFRHTCTALGIGEPRGELVSLNLVYAGGRPTSRG